MESPKDYCSANTRVFWDVDDFPIPENGDLCAFRSKVRRALEMEGYYGSHLTIFAYVSDEKAMVDEERRQFAMAEIPLMCVNVEKRSRLSKMILEMLAWAFQNPNPNKAILLIVAKDIPEGDTEFGRVLGILAERGYHVFCTVPDDFPQGQLPPAGPRKDNCHQLVLQS
ncbi:PREDICTED: uncharacterized protein LOC104755196 [Camelina sativa]|uniref:Uncharacterized protein LOC104755196 n=1 Tax=Camelina sativa TaxID=90675 RepID=A0ABM0WTA3_CAMSA|nr:PREDICTED: uncharacterized protein LOC104755196 [Camelina sativa]